MRWLGKKQLGMIVAAGVVLVNSIDVTVYAAEESKGSYDQESKSNYNIEEIHSTEEEVSAGCALEDGEIGYVALGDSIPNGYCADGEPEMINYPNLLVADLKELGGDCVEFSQFTKNGLSAKKMNKTILQDEAVLSELETADVVTLTVGANDLMNEFKKVAREILNNEKKFHNVYEAMEALQEGISENPLLLVKCAGALGDWDYASFEKEWIAAVKTIDEQCPEQSQLVVTTIYNPVERMELPGTLNAVIETIISKMNKTMYDHAEEYDYRVVDLFDSGIGGCTQSDGLHPNQEGQDMIRNLIVGELDLDAFSNEKLNEEIEARKQKEMEEAARKAAEKAERAKSERKKKIIKYIGLSAAIVSAALIIGLFLKKYNF